MMLHEVDTEAPPQLLAFHKLSMFMYSDLKNVKLRRLSERLASLGIMGPKLVVPFKLLNTIVL